MLNPRVGNIALDANALDYDGVRDQQIDRLLQLSSEEKLSLVIPSSVKKEVINPKTPARVQELFGDQIFTVDVGRTPREQQVLKAVQDLMRGNAQPGKHAADGEHIFEAQKYCRFFVTNDARILNKREALCRLIGKTLAILTVDELLAAFDATN
jgi:hypothetical protein